MGHGMCQATGFVLTFLGMASINNLVAISIFRYLVIRFANVRCNPAQFKVEKSYFRITSVCTAGRWCTASY